VLQLGQRVIAERLLHLDGLAGLEELVDVGRHQERNDIVLSMRVRSAVIPAAGLGSRFLPASKAVPKEMFPIGHRPALQIVVDEALGAGCDHVVIVSSASKPAIERYFRRDEELIARLRDEGDDMLADQLDAVNRDWRATIVYQDRPRGLGHAVGCARDAVGDQPFAVLLPDALMGSAGVLAQMNGVCAATGGSVVAVVNVPREQVVDYGVIEPSGPQTPDGVIPIRGLVEKPSVEDAPSNYVLTGRYVLTADAWDEIARLRPGRNGELQLTDALRVQAQTGAFHGVVAEVSRHDTGYPFGFLLASIELGLRDPEIGPRLRDHLRRLEL
jgi:UTP--glucose-1-phosphate uridylyltransferase